MSPLTGPPPILSSYWLARWPITRSRFWPARGEGGDQYNTTTCGMAEGSKDPCISHVDASHAEWPRIESSLLFCYFFILSKSLKKACFLRVKWGSLERKLPRLGIDIFRICWHLRHFRAISLWKKQGPFHPWSFWWGLTNTVSPVWACLCIWLERFRESKKKTSVGLLVFKPLWLLLLVLTKGK